MKTQTVLSRFHVVLALCLATPIPSSALELPMFESDTSERFPIVELRRYVVKEGQRTTFAEYFETWFPDAFRQLGAIAFGQFLEQDDPTRFTWLRGFPDLDARARINAEFYYGPLWKEHTAVMNGLMVDSDQVLLLRPTDEHAGIPVLPSTDPLADSAAPRGLAVMQIFQVRPGALQAFAAHAEAVTATYEVDGVRRVGLLQTLDVANNFPQLPVLEDGPYVVWLGLAENPETLRQVLKPVMDRAEPMWRGDGRLVRKPELVVMKPTRRSRIRWTH